MTDGQSTPRDDRTLARDLLRAEGEITRLAQQASSTSQYFEGELCKVRQQSKIQSLNPVTLSFFKGTLEENFSEWIESFDLAAVAGAWDDATKLNMLPAYLREVALEAYRDLTDNDKRTYTVLVHKLSERLQPR